MTVSTVPAVPPVDVAVARSALASVVPRLTGLIRSVRQPAAPAVGEWNAGQVAAHLVDAWEVLPALLRGEMSSPLQGVADLAGLTTALVREHGAMSLDEAAGRIEAAAARYLATPVVEDGDHPWLVQGVRLPASVFACHLLNETLVHGHDIARAERRRWDIDPAHAGLAITGFVIPALSSIDPRSLVDADRTAGVRACIDVRIRRTGRAYLIVEDGTLRFEPPSDRRVDCHIATEPVTWFLLIWSRIGPWRAALRGGAVVWGRRPWLGTGLQRMVRNP